MQSTAMTDIIIAHVPYPHSRQSVQVNLESNDIRLAKTRNKESEHKGKR